MSKLPAIQFYPGDWRKDPGIQSLSYEERGIWLELLFMMHESEKPGLLLLGGVPYPTDRLARALRLDNQVMSKVISDLITLNVASVDEETGALMCRRMVRDREFIEKRKKCGKMGGNPNFQTGKPNPYYTKDNLKDNLGNKREDKQKITPSSSPSGEDGVLLEKPKRKRSSDGGEEDSDFVIFWNIYPNKVAKGKARLAWVKALKITNAETILSAVEVQKKNPKCSLGGKQEFVPHPSSWLNAERWCDPVQEKESRIIRDREERERYFLEHKNDP